MEDRATRLAPAGWLRDRRLQVAAALLAVATAAAYAPAASNGFVLYDDGLYILEVPQVRRGLTPGGVEWAFTSLQGANWFPLTRLSWMLDAQLYGTDAAGFHRTSLLLHGLAALLALWAFAAMTGRVWASAFVAAVFALHPLHVESVAWAAARKDVLSGVFWMLALVAHAAVAARDGRGGARGPKLALASALALGLMAKPTLVVLPFVLLLLDFWPLRRIGGVGATRRIGLQRAIREKAALFAIAAAGAAVTLVAQQSGGAIQSLDAIPLRARLDNAVVALVAYVAKAFWPAGLAVYYPHPLDTLPVWQVGASAAAIAGLCAAAWWLRDRAPELGVGWLWFVGSLVPVIGIVQVGQAALADRYTYLPLVGLSLPVAFGAARWARSRGARIACAGLGAACAVAMAFATRAQVAVWHDSRSLFEHALAVTERNHVAHINLGVVAVNERRWSDAERHLRQALRYAPRSAKAHGVLGDALRGLGRPDEALGQYRAALERDPGSARWQTAVGNALLDLGRAGEAEASYRRALQRGANAELLASLGVALLELGRRDEAIGVLQQAVEGKPQLASARGSLGIALLGADRVDAAIAQLERALARDDSLVSARAHLALALARRDGPEAGLAQIRGAIERSPDDAALRAIAGRLSHAAGRSADAIADYEQAVALGDRSTDSLNNLAWLLATETPPADPRRERAVALAEQAAAASHTPPVLDTLATAYAGAGRFALAAETAESAAALAQSEGDEPLAQRIRERLADYRARAER